MKSQSIAGIICLAATVAIRSSAFAQPTLNVELVTGGPSWSSLERTTLGDNILFITGAGVNRVLYRFDGQAVAPIDNPFGNNQPSFLTNAQLNGEIYFRANSPGGTALFKSNGLTTQLVADLNPSLDFDQSIQNLYTFGNYVFMSAAGPNGFELFRSNGTTVTEFDLRSGAASSNPTRFISFRNQALFNATDSNGLSTLYRIRTDSPESLGPYNFPSNPIEFENNLYWAGDGKLYKYDGDQVTTLLQTSEINSLSLGYIDSQVFGLTGNGATGWEALTWDGFTLREFDVHAGGGNPVNFVVANPMATGVYFWTGSDGLFRIDNEQATKVLAQPGAGAFGTGGVEGVVAIDGHYLVKTAGPSGKEIYRLDGDAAYLVGDINPSGDAFPLTSPAPTELNGKMYLIGYNSSSAAIYRTDGNSMSLVSNIATEPNRFADQFLSRLSDLPLLLFQTNYVPPGGGSSTNFVYVTDGTGIAELSSFFPLSAELDYQLRYQLLNGVTYAFGRSGNIYRIAAVPEPSLFSILLVGVLVSALCRHRDVCLFRTS